MKIGLFINMASSNLKLAIKVKLLDNNAISFNVIHVHPNVHKWTYPLLFVNDDDNYTVEKSYYTLYTRFKFIIPFRVSEKERELSTSKCTYTFESERDRYDCLNKFRINLLDFSRSYIFKNLKYNLNSQERNKIMFYKDMWFLY